MMFEMESGVGYVKSLGDETHIKWTNARAQDTRAQWQVNHFQQKVIKDLKLQ